ncbi:hypothetical protein [Clostridium ihumii]|uniref:hypothetical protein n=1 Tax=Clostridium ihumii TaxID=1470356 RepID=UPI00058FC99B|nr:hypothetical protein [Clostridium ihumii]
MTKENFNRLPINKQIDTINTLIYKLGSINKACKEIGIAKSTVRDRFKSKGYYYNIENKKYELEIEVISSKNEHEPINNIGNNSGDNNRNIKYYDNKLDNTEDYECKFPSITLTNQTLLALNFITENLGEFKKIINNKNVIGCNYVDSEIIMPTFNGDNMPTTIKVNKAIWNDFSELASYYKQYSKQDIISLAFKEFIDKYRK